MSEEDINTLEHFIINAKGTTLLNGSIYSYEVRANQLKSLENLLGEFYKQQKEIEELTTNQLDIKDKCIEIAKKLEEDGKTFVAEYILAQVGTCPVWECGEPYFNYISKQKIKDKIEELNREEEEAQNSIDDKEREEYSDANISHILCNIETKREVLKELLEE